MKILHSHIQNFASTHKKILHTHTHTRARANRYKNVYRVTGLTFLPPLTDLTRHGITDYKNSVMQYHHVFNKRNHKPQLG